LWWHWVRHDSLLAEIFWRESSDPFDGDREASGAFPKLSEAVGSCVEIDDEGPEI
jgi:hypothetical protein